MLPCVRHVAGVQQQLHPNNHERKITMTQHSASERLEEQRERERYIENTLARNGFVRQDHLEQHIEDWKKRRQKGGAA